MRPDEREGLKLRPYGHARKEAGGPPGGENQRKNRRRKTKQGWFASCERKKRSFAGPWAEEDCLKGRNGRREKKRVDPPEGKESGKGKVSTGIRRGVLEP